MKNKVIIPYSIGDWVILKKEQILKWKKQGVFAEFIERYDKPMKIAKIYTRFNDNRVYITFEDDIMNSINENEFRKATENEIKKQKIKNIFIENNKENMDE